MSAKMMLDHMGDTRDDEACLTASMRIERAYMSALEAGETTKDLGGTLSTTEFAGALSARLA
jgi:3-isopropylmalate dehydrogenase